MRSIQPGWNESPPWVTRMGTRLASTAEALREEERSGPCLIGERELDLQLRQGCPRRQFGLLHEVENGGADESRPVAVLCRIDDLENDEVLDRIGSFGRGRHDLAVPALETVAPGVGTRPLALVDEDRVERLGSPEAGIHSDTLRPLETQRENALRAEKPGVSAKGEQKDPGWVRVRRMPRRTGYRPAGSGAVPRSRSSPRLQAPFSRPQTSLPDSARAG